MDIRPIKGNTWVLEGMEWIPFYKLDERRCILLDTGLLGEREDLEQTLLDHGLTPAGILCSHAHVDHGGNNRYFQEKYQIPVALTAKEAGMCAGLLNLKCYFLMLPPGMVEREAAHLVHTPDVIVPDRDGPLSFCGAEVLLRSGVPDSPDPRPLGGPHRHPDPGPGVLCGGCPPVPGAALGQAALLPVPSGWH